MNRKTLLEAVVLLVALPPGLLLADERSPGGSAAEVRRLEEKLIVYEALNRLELSEAQAERLLSIVAEARGVAAAYRQREEALLTESLAAFEAYRDETLDGCGVSAPVEERAGDLNHRGQDLSEEYFAAIGRLEEAASGILTPRRREAFSVAPLGDRHAPVGDPVSELRRQREQVREGRRGTMGAIGEFLVSPYAENALRLRLGREPTAEARDVRPHAHLYSAPIPATREGLEGTAADLHDVRRSINLVNLINALNLSREQVDGLIEVNHSPAERRGKPQAIYDTPAGQAYRRLLEETLASVEHGGSLTAQQRAQIERVRRGAVAAGQAARRPRGEAQSVGALLTNAQKEVLLDYDPCIIPEDGAAAQPLVGQASVSSRHLDFLRRVRGVPEPQGQGNRNGVLARVVGGAERSQGEMTPAQRQEFASRLTEIVVRVRALDDVEFQLQQDEILADMEFMDREGVLKEEIIRVAGRESEIARKTRLFLLDEAILPLLEERARRPAEGSAATPADLDRIAPAESCRDGRCAIDPVGDR